MRTISVPKSMFLAGLCLFTLGQILINFGREFVKNQTPVDFAHWCLIGGVLLLIPFAARFPKNLLSFIGSTLLILGITGVIGMSALDFVFWSLPTAEMEQEWGRHLFATKTIWTPFMTVGPGTLFNVGLLAPSLFFFKQSKLGLGLVLVGSLTVFVGTQWFNVIGYVIISIGYWLCFRA